MTTPYIKSLEATIPVKYTTLNPRKVTVVKPKPDDRSAEKVLMLLGATGTGKSTLINGMANYIMGVEYKDKYRYKLIEEEGSKSQAHSQTKCITAYTFQKQDYQRLPYNFTIIDTPGYGDTEGLERDKKITKQIKEFFSIKGEQGIDHLDGIGFVVPSSQARLTPTQQYIFNSILGIFGKDFSKNIFLMVTFADGNEPPVLKAIKEANIEYQKAFKFNNSALFAEVENESDDDEDSMDFNSMYWKMGEKSFGHFFTFFNKVNCVSLQLTKEVLKEREHLECVVQGLQEGIQRGLTLADQLRQEEIILKQHEKDLEMNKDFEYEVTVNKQRKVELDKGKHVTNCLTCHTTCHYPCKLERDDEKSGCAAMDRSNGRCKVCPGKCYWDKHVNNKYRIEWYEELETRTSEELKARYCEAESKKNVAEGMTAGLKIDMKNVQLVVYGKERELNGVLHHLDEIALRPNAMTDIQHIDLLIESEKQQAKPGFQRRITALKDVRKQAEIIKGVKDKAKVRKMFDSAASMCWKRLKFW